MKKAEREAHRAWLATLKAGDEVAVQETQGLKPVGVPSISSVTSVSEWSIEVLHPVRAAPRSFDVFGVKRRDSFELRMILLPVTDEVRRVRRGSDCRRWLGSLGWNWWNSVPDAVVEQVLATLAEYERSKGGAVKP